MVGMVEMLVVEGVSIAISAEKRIIRKFTIFENIFHKICVASLKMCHQKYN